MNRLKLTPEQAAWARSKVAEWLRIKFDHEQRGIPVSPDLRRLIESKKDYAVLLWSEIPGLRQLEPDADHSALLYWLLTGHDPLPEPPPLQYSYPVYPKDPPEAS